MFWQERRELATAAIAVNPTREELSAFILWVYDEAPSELLPSSGPYLGYRGSTAHEFAGIRVVACQHAVALGYGMVHWHLALAAALPEEYPLGRISRDWHGGFDSTAMLGPWREQFCAGADCLLQESWLRPPVIPLHSFWITHAGWASLKLRRIGLRVKSSLIN